MLKLGVLDQVHIGEGKTAKEALEDSVRLAQAVEKMGYTRFWVSEHHGMEALAFSSPEVLIAHLAAATSRIRVGSGGIMLPHYSAYKVAENFRLLEALHPSRIDLGLGRAPGGMPLATRALQQYKYMEVDHYPQQVLDLIGYLHEALPSGHPFKDLLASPSIPTAPEIWMLGSSGESAKLAAILGTSYAFAEFFGTPGGEEAMRHYQSNFESNVLLEEKPRSMIAVMVICAETQEEADRLAASSDLYWLGLRTGQRREFLPSVKTAMDYPYTESERELIRVLRKRRVIGNPEQVKEQMLRLGRSYNVEEIMITCPVHDQEARINSFKLVAEVFQMI